MNKKTSIYFKEGNLLCFAVVYGFFIKTNQVKRVKILNAYRRNNEILDKAIKEQVFHSNPFCGHILDNIFGYGAFCHYNEYSRNTRTKLDNEVNVKCYRFRRINDIFNFLVYWILVEAMFIASLWKEIIMIYVYLIGLFSKYGIWIVIVKIKKCEGKETEASVELS